VVEWRRSECTVAVLVGERDAGLLFGLVAPVLTGLYDRENAEDALALALALQY